MISHMHGIVEPFDLHDGIVYFHDWRYVSHGGYRWTDTDGGGHGIWSPGAHPPVQFAHHDTPHGIELVSFPAERGQAVVHPGATELVIYGGSLLHDEGVYRLWYECWQGQRMGERGFDHYNVLRYAESDDGVTWRFPDLGARADVPDAPKNVVFGAPENLRYGLHGAGVFKDPAAPAAARYKMVWMGAVSPDDFATYRVKYPSDIDPLAHEHNGGATGLCGAVSPDGLRWTVLEEPLLIQTTDTHNVCEYDPVRQTYVSYLRTWLYGRRTIGRTETADFRHFPLPEETFWPSAAMKPYDLWYVNAKTKMPGTRDYHVMFPMRWRLTHDEFTGCLATSPDNVVWNLFPGEPVLRPGDPGAWDGGGTAPGLGMAALPGGRMGLLYGGHPVPHKHPRFAPYGALGWATWQTGRLTALRAEEVGAFCLTALNVKGRTVRLNYRVPIGGHIRVEVVGPDGAVAPGRSFTDCDFLRGDELDGAVTWRGQTHLGIPDDQPVRLRFQLQTADLFAIRFVESQ